MDNNNDETLIYNYDESKLQIERVEEDLAKQDQLDDAIIDQQSSQSSSQQMLKD